ncbi:MAG: hypothetical protein FJ100_13490 [Deltaproteobacteria bacterium]|nr:hypothetical protein [Deltaproteobacteria bacterium]
MSRPPFLAVALLLALPTSACTDPAAVANDTVIGADVAMADTTDAGTAGTDIASGSEAGATDAAAADAAPSDTAQPQCQSAADCPLPGPCQVAACTPSGTCAYAPKADATPCNDGNACTTGDLCAAGTCAGPAKLDCNDDNPCTAENCNPYGGCVFLAVAASAACDDGDACTVGDACASGNCQPGVAICQCQTNGDCGKYEDGNLCNGNLYCDKSTGPPYTCKLNPATVVVCPTTNDSACQKNVCVPATAQCKLQLAPANTPCDDGVSCTTGDFCEQGLCVPGANTCFCKQDSDCAASEDGNLCNGTLFCNKATAQCQVNPVTVVSCQTVDDTACTKNQCNPKDGKCHLLPIADGKPCDDGNACTPNEACAAGNCTSPVNTCECEKDADCGKKDDGNPCNGTLYCDVVAKNCKTNPATVVSCNTGDDPPCLADTCDVKTGKCALVTLPKDGTACDDGNACTAQSACGGGQCLGGANLCECQKDADCAAKEDGNVCNGTLYCNPASKKCEVNPATVVACSATFDEPCLTNQCDPKTGGCGMKPAHQGNQCDDGSVCSGGGWCVLGACVVTTKTACECVQDADCAKLEDGDLCNGTLYCDKSAKQPMCKLNPSTVVVCKTVDDTACSKAQCVPKTGACALAPVNGPCDDGKVCTSPDACSNGACAGLAKACDDGIACTADTCQEPFGCVAPPGAATACDDANPCTQDQCTTKGCAHAPVPGPCDDGNACTSQDACGTGKCAGTVSGCDDGNPCTVDVCDAAKGCLSAPTTAPCSDGNACTKGDACDKGKCAGSPQGCDDANPCTDDGCDPKVGCTATPNTAPCDDNSACTAKDVCKAGACGGATGACDDGNPCTDDACVAGKCAHPNNQAECSDGNACTQGDLCALGACTPGKKLDCNDSNACTADSCDAKTGCIQAAAAGACDDANACTVNDACANGLCVGAKKACDDANPCTTDNCDAKAGCQVAANAAPCSDDNPCTLGDACTASACAPGKPKDCGDNNACTTDSCVPSTGQCQNLDQSAKLCNDANPCTDDPCHALLGCGHVNNTGACSDGNPCTTGDGCLGGNCATSGALTCDDANACTDDACDPKAGGCTFAPNTKPCDDQLGCTQGDACAAGKCAGILSCDDKNACTDDACDFKSAKCAYTANTASCDDGNPCSQGDTCKTGTCTPTGLKNCDDGNACTDDACDSKVGCFAYANKAPCSTGGCKVDDTCADKSCKAGTTDRLGEWRVNVPVNGYSHFEARGVLPIGDDWIVYGSASTTESSAVPGLGDAWIARTTQMGKVVWQLAGGQVSATVSQSVIGRVILAPGGDLLAFGGSGGGHGAMTRISSGGKALEGAFFNFSTNAMTYGDTVERPGAKDLVSLCSAGAAAGMVLHDPKTGLEVGEATYDSKGAPAGFRSAAVGADGASLVVVGWSKESGTLGGTDGLVAFYGPDLAKPPVKLLRFGTTGDDELRAVARAPDGGWVVTGFRQSSGSNGKDVWWLRMRPEGTVVYDKTYASYADDFGLGVLVQADSSVLVVGAIGSGNYAGQDAALLRLDLNGGYTQPYATGGGKQNEFLHRVLTLPNGDVLAAGRAPVTFGTNQAALLVRATAYMHTTCVGAGICASKPMAVCAKAPIGCNLMYCYQSGSGCTPSWTQGAPCDDGDACTLTDSCLGDSVTCKGTAPPQACDDKNPCTFDTCDKQLGCQNANVSDGVVCGTGKSCKAGVCQ